MDRVVARAARCVRFHQQQEQYPKGVSSIGGSEDEVRDDEKGSGFMAMVVYGVLLVVGILLLVIATVRVSLGGPTDAHGQASGSDDKSARGILDERYAADELSTQEYEHRLRVLKGDNS